MIPISRNTLAMPGSADRKPSTTRRRLSAEAGVRLGVLDNSKGNADHLLRFIVEGVKAVVPVASVTRSMAKTRSMS